ncbi:MAG TPA: hypothetical protein VF268_02785 [Gammaproteobacteria bacterium]
MIKLRGLLPTVVAACVMASMQACAEMGDATQTICADGTDKLCSTLPTDMAGHPPMIGYIPSTSAGGTGGFNQTFIDYFGWQAFVALNWPVDKNGKPSTTETIVTDTTSPRVWSTYATKEEVFDPQVVGVDDSDCGDDDPGTLKVFRTSKFQLTSFIEAFTPYPLIDRNGNFVVYDVRLNDTEVNYLERNNLTTKQGQKAFGKPYDFTAGEGAKVGSIEIKTAWRIMTDKDDAGSFYTTDATIVVPPKFSQTGKQLCIDDVKVGLVGMHIMQKFTNPSDFSDFWSWATFEHVNNAPLADNAPVSQINAASKLKDPSPPSCSLAPNPADKTQYSFYNVACNDGKSACAVNAPPSALGDVFKWSEKQPYASAYLTKGKGGALFGTQVARCFDIYDSADAVTNDYHSQFGNSVWKNYMLVGVQWAAAGNTGSGPFAKLKPFPAPVYLANTTLETYVQDTSVEDPKSGAGSCIICHNLAKDTAGNDSNFSFLPHAAQ